MPRKKRKKGVLGVTHDGIEIRRPHGKPKSFTIPQLRRAIKKVKGR